MMLVDSHCHLDYPELAGDMQGVLARARDAGVGHMVTICTKVHEFQRIAPIAEAHANISCTVGTHPHHAAEEPDVTTDQLVALAAHPKIVGIGETGLDFFYDSSPRDIQEQGFRRHIRAAIETGLPLVVHSRDAEADTMRILRDEDDGSRISGVMHCFSSGRQLAEDAVEFGFYISLSGILTFKKSDELRAITADVPLDRLLVETDSPYLAPAPYRGKPNEPSYVVHTARMLAEVKGVSEADIIRITTENFKRLFNRAALAEAA